MYWLTLQRSQWYKPDKLFKIQERKIRRLLRWAITEVEFYRELYQIKDVSQINKDKRLLQRLPILTREVISNTPLNKRTASSIDLRKTIKRTTSGSTGIPVTILETRSSAAYWQALYLRRLWAYGVRPGDKVLRMLPSVAPAGIKFFIGRNPLEKFIWQDLRLLDMSPGIDSSFLKEIAKLGIDVMISQPSSISAIMRKLEETSLNLSFKIIITTGEVLTPSTRRKIQDRFGCDVYDSYSTVELGNIAWECPTHTAYHINADSLVLELNDPRQVGRSSIEGEAIGTCLYRYATPLIRYSTGDLVRLRDDECPCGRGLPLLVSVEGRIVEYIVTKNGKLISPSVITSALQSIGGIKQFKVVQHPDYTVEVRVVTADEMDHEQLSSLIEATLTPLLHGLKTRVRFTDSIEIRGVKLKLVESFVSK
jgi:phenylacetate-CoA ligase